MSQLQDDNRFVIFPIKHTDIWEMYKKHVASFWTTEEIDMATDIADWKELCADEKHFLKHVLAFFSSADGIVNENLVMRFYNEIPSSECRAFYSFQIAMETIHSETYSLMINTLVESEEEQNKLFYAALNMPSIGLKTKFALDWLDSSASLQQRLVAFTCVEGIFFSGSFCAIFWLKKRGILPGLTFSNELISRDEGLHTDFSCLVYSKLEPLSEDIIFKIIKDAVKIEESFICDALPCSLVGMNCNLMTKYIHFVADRLAVQLGCNKIYNVDNPFDWMDLISLQGKTNFFERRVGEYQKANVMASLAESNVNKFSITEEF